MDESRVEVFPKDIQIFQPDGHQSPILIKIAKVNKAYNIETRHLNLTKIKRGRKKSFFVESARSSRANNMPGSDSKFIFLCLEEFIQLIVNCFVPNLALNEKT